MLDNPGVKEWFKKLWHDPVGSKLIAELIKWFVVVTVGGGAGGFGLYLWSRSNFSFNAVQAWAAAADGLHSFRHWFAEPISLPRGVALAIIGVVVSVSIYIRLRVARHMASQGQRLQEALTRQRESAAALEQAHADLTEMQRIKEAEQSNPKPIDSGGLRVLQVLYGVYPGGRTLGAVAATTGESYPVTERSLDALALQGLTRFFPGSYTEGSAWFLTKKGRDYCVEKGFRS